VRLDRPLEVNAQFLGRIVLDGAPDHRAKTEPKIREHVCVLVIEAQIHGRCSARARITLLVEPVRASVVSA